MELEVSVDKILRAILKTSNINSEISVSNCESWDSLAQISIVTTLEQTFGFKVLSSEIPRLTSRQEMIKYLTEKIGHAQSQ